MPCHGELSHPSCELIMCMQADRTLACGNSWTILFEVHVVPLRRAVRMEMLIHLQQPVCDMAVQLCKCGVSGESECGAET